MTEDNILIAASYVQISSYRYKVVDNIKPGDVMMPRDIAKATGILPNHISKVLRDLKDNNIMVCINPEVRKGRLYRLTPLGEEVKKYLDEE